MKDGVYAVNTHECKSIGTQRIDIFMQMVISDIL